MSDLRPRGADRRATPPVARHGRLRSSGPVGTIVKYLAAALAVVLVSAGAVTAYAVWDVAQSVKPGVALIGETEGPPPNIGAYEGGVNFLLVGSDSGQGDPKYGKRGETLNDVTILLHISADHTNATVVSFPRDMFVKLPACPKLDGKGNYASWTTKLNESLAYGGLACTVQTVSDLTGLTIPFAAMIEFNGVIEMANAIGGVEVCVGTAIHDRQISLNLDAGQQTISGYTALQFLRSRYGVGDGSDLSRISNQQVFLSALVRKVKSAETLTDPLKVYGLAKAAISNMQMSRSLENVNTIVSIALALKDIAPENISFLQYPSGYGAFNGRDGVLPIKSAADKLFSAIKADLPVKLTGTTGDGSTVDPNVPTPVSTDPPLPGTVDLPSEVKGQSAAVTTCSKGQTAGG